MKTKNIVLLLSLLFSLGCNSGSQKLAIAIDQSFEPSDILAHSDTVKFELDSLTAPLILALQVYNNGNDNFLIYLNEEIGTLYINDIETKKIVKSIVLKDSSEHHKKEFQGFYYHNKDSIFLFGFKPRVVLINDLGEVKRQYILTDGINDGDLDLVRGLWSSTTNREILLDDTLYLNSVVVGGNQISAKRIQIKLDLKTGGISSGDVIFPQLYRDYNFGDINYDIYSSAANERDNLLVYSFPAYENLIIYNTLDRSIEEKPAISKFFDSFITYDESNYKDAFSSPTLEYFMTTPCFGGIYYDKFRKMYYRIALLPVSEKNVNYEKRNPQKKQLAIIVLDENFKYLGEKKLEQNEYLMFSAFVSDKGLNIQQKSDNDESLNFTTFNFSNQN